MFKEARNQEEVNMSSFSKHDLRGEPRAKILFTGERDLSDCFKGEESSLPK